MKRKILANISITEVRNNKTKRVIVELVYSLWLVFKKNFIFLNSQGYKGSCKHLM